MGQYRSHRIPISLPFGVAFVLTCLRWKRRNDGCEVGREKGREGGREGRGSTGLVEFPFLSLLVWLSSLPA